MSVLHLIKRFCGSLSARPIAKTDNDWVLGVLSNNESQLWSLMSASDQRHSLLVAKRFMLGLPEASHFYIAGVLLHDVGKIRSNLGPLARVAATIFGPRSNSFRQYHDHEIIGVELLKHAKSHPDTIAILLGTAVSRIDRAFRDADNI